MQGRIGQGTMTRRSPAPMPAVPSQREGMCIVPVESSGHSQGNPRLFELIEHSPKTGKSPTVWAWPELIDYLKVAGQPVQGPWPPHQQARPDPDEDSLPVAVPDPQARPAPRPDPVGSAAVDLDAVGPDELGGPDSIDPHRTAP
jgi:hypothetical protein